MTVLQSFPPEICSLICQDPNLERLDLNSICFISHAFRKEAQRELSSHFPILRSASRIKAWCHALTSKPHTAIDIKGLVLLMPSDRFVTHKINLQRALRKCVNLKELVVLSSSKRRQWKDSSHAEFWFLPLPYKFKLTKLVNGYLPQDDAAFTRFLRRQRKLESLELHSGKTDVSKSQLSLDCLKTLGCPAEFLNTSYSVSRLRLNFENSTDNREIDELGRVLRRNLTRNMNSLAIFFNREQSDFPDIMRVIAVSHIYIHHLEIHQFLPTQVKKDLPLPVNIYGRNIRTLVFRPPRGLPEKGGHGHNSHLCAYVELRTPIGRRKVAEKLIMRTLPTLTRLVLVVHGNNYEFRRNLFTGVITGEILITRDTREWVLAK